jgi:hypothetical protein
MDFLFPKHTNSVLLWKCERKRSDVKNVIYSRILQKERKSNKFRALNIKCNKRKRSECEQDKRRSVDSRDALIRKMEQLLLTCLVQQPSKNDNREIVFRLGAISFFLSQTLLDRLWAPLCPIFNFGPLSAPYSTRTDVQTDET